MLVKFQFYNLSDQSFFIHRFSFSVRVFEFKWFHFLAISENMKMNRLEFNLRSSKIYSNSVYKIAIQIGYESWAP